VPDEPFHVRRSISTIPCLTGGAELTEKGHTGLAAYYTDRGEKARIQTVAGYDLTFSPVRSVSTLWAVAPPPSRGHRTGPPGRRAGRAAVH
jgi:hypothetical protein